MSRQLARRSTGILRRWYSVAPEVSHDAAGPASSKMRPDQQSSLAGVPALESALEKRDWTKVTELFRSFDREELMKMSQRGVQARLFGSVQRYHPNPRNADVKTSEEQLSSPSPSSSPLSMKELYDKFIGLRIRQGYPSVSGWMASGTIIELLHKDQAEEALEIWVKFVEAQGSPSRAVSGANREAAVSALAAYILSCHKSGQEVDAQLAMKLVPLNTGAGTNIPLDSEFFRLQNPRKRFSREVQDIISQGFKKVRLMYIDPNSVEYLGCLPGDRPLELDLRYSEAKQKSEQTGVELSEPTYARFIQCYTECTRIQTAFDIWNTMLENGVTPGPSSWNALLKAGALTRGTEAERVAIVENLFKKMTGEHGVAPNSDTYAILLDMYFRCNECEKALELFDKLKNSEIPSATVTIKVFNVALNGLLSVGLLEEAEKLLEAGSKAGLTPDVISYNTFISSYIKRGSYDKVQLVLDEMEKEKVTPDITTYTNVVDTLFKSGEQNAEKIEKLLKEMSNNGLASTTISVTSIMRGLIKTFGDIEAARMLFDIMLKKHISPNNRTFSTIIDGELTTAKGSLEHALHYFNMMPKFNMPQPTPIYNQLIKYMSSKPGVATNSRSGSVNGNGDNSLLFQAYGLLERMTVSPRPNMYSYYFLLAGCLRQNNGELFSQVAQHMAKMPKSFGFGDVIPDMLRTAKSRGFDVPEDLLKRVEKL